MIIAIMSDLHDNTVAWTAILRYLKAQKIKRLINCGDTCAPDMLKELSTTFSGQIDTVFGNVADRELEVELVKSLKNVTHHGDQGSLTIENRKIFFNHFPNIADRMAKRGDFDVVCHGHTHLKRWEPIGYTMILNPGTAGGMFQYPSFATLELTPMKCSFIDITL